jgi:linoleate 10R-lipoxygenase
MVFAFASLVTHSIFRTDPSDWSKNNTSSYLDLSPLYGSNQEEQDAVRFKDGRGLLYPDVFSEGRLVFLPPASAALLVMWNRNHNYIATNIWKINERKLWTDPPPTDEKLRAKQDEEIFQTARLINCASFMSVICECLLILKVQSIISVTFIPACSWRLCFRFPRSQSLRECLEYESI